MSANQQIRRSTTRLQRQGMVWFQETRAAGETFVRDSRGATVTFARDLQAATDTLIASCGKSAKGLRKAWVKEAHQWQQLVIKTRDAYEASAREQLTDLWARAVSTREALTPESVETTVLQSTRDLLQRAQTSVDARIDKSATPTKAAQPARVAKPAKAKKASATKTATEEAPIRNYDEMTAKDVVNRVQRLSGPQATAVLDYERARKKRATVIRAAEKRLAAAS